MYAHCDDDNVIIIKNNNNNNNNNNNKNNNNNNNNNNNKHFSNSRQFNASGSFSQTWINFAELRLKFFHIEGNIFP